ncbi:hypothetical protein [Kordiimonas aestuarii]|uniref:hypothetical protein n=1 Tax=Kordiimonas aestuarii TaxID=1005925 RepID=UPI0021CEB516|nr:hypothetical protein [Kordiimonas aestuarii]
MSLGQSVHFEIMGRRGTRWTILEVVNDRKFAVEKAEELWGSKRFTGIRVLKESYDKVNQEFASVEIYSRGASRKTSKYDQTGTISPCLTPDDLYSADGRRAIWELLGNTLGDWMITPTELLHSLDHYYKLYNAGTKLQNAVQRTAVSYENDQSSIQERMRKITKVIDTSVEIMKANKEKTPSLEVGRLKPVIEVLQDRSNKRFLLIAAITDYLQPAVTLSDKVGRLIAMLSGGRPAWVLEILDQMIAEMFLHPSILGQILDEPEDRSRFMIWLSYLQAGRLNMMGENERSPVFSDEILRLNGFLSEGQMPQVARALFGRLKIEIDAAKPICPGGLVDQLKGIDLLKHAIDELQDDVGMQESLEEALASRAGRLLNSQAVGEMLYETRNPIDQINALLDLEKFTIGHSNKRMVANFMLPVLTRPEYESIFVGLDSNQPMQRMHDLVLLQKRIMEADLTEMHRRKIAEKLDAFCRAILDNTQILKKLHNLNISLQDKAKKILSLMADNYFTAGDCRNRADHQVRIYMKQPGFTEGLIKGMARAEAEKELKEFRDLLDRAGFIQSAQAVKAAEEHPAESDAEADKDDAADTPEAGDPISSAGSERSGQQNTPDKDDGTKGGGN